MVSKFFPQMAKPIELHTGRYVKYNMKCKSVAGYSAVKPMTPVYP